MESKKVNIFAFVMIIVMCAFTIFVSVNAGNGKDGQNGLSAYEEAVRRGVFDGSELEWLQSLQGEDGSTVTIEDVYNAYLAVNNKTSDEVSFAAFINTYYPDALLDDATEKALSEFAASQALRSTVDIVYSFCTEKEVIAVEENTVSGEPIYLLNKNTDEPSVGVSAGSGVIYQINADTAYIITNYHVVYVNSYSNNPEYDVYYNSTKGTYFTAKHNTSDEFKVSVPSMFGSVLYDAVYTADVTAAPIEVNFLEEYEVYLYGYQADGYGLSATFVGGSADNDIAVLKIDKNSSNQNNKRIFNGDYKQAVLGDSTKLAVGEYALAVGNPLIPDTSKIDTSAIETVDEYVEAYKQSYVSSLCLTATDGVVSNISEYQTFESLVGGGTTNMRLIRVSSAINAGNSGGGLYDLDGNLIGIVNGKIASSDYDNVGYAIPVNVAVNLADRIIAECGGISGEANIKIVTNKSLGLEVYSARSGEKAPYYDEAKMEWVNACSVAVESTQPLKLASTLGIKAGDFINYIQIGETKYYLNNDYDFNDVLLKVSVPQTSVAIKFNVTTKISEGNLDTRTIDVLLDSSYFAELK